MIAIASDHGGFALKEAVKDYLNQNKIDYIDFGTDSTESVNYAKYAFKVANAITSGECSRGILCCGTGIGISIAANKVKGIRAAVCTNSFCTEMTRRHNDANILCMGGRVISCEEAVKLTDIFLNTPFDGGRHSKRVDEISAIEKGKFK